MNEATTRKAALQRILFRLAGISVILLSFAAGWLLLDYRTFVNTPLQVDENGSEYLVTPGTSLARLANGLASRGFIEQPRYLRLLGRWMGVSQKLKAGEYHIASGTTPAEFLQMLVDGRVRLYSFTIVEGWTFRQMMEMLQQNETLLHTLRDPQGHTLDGESIMQRLGFPQQHPEGRFFPETYHFPRGTSDVDFLRRAYHLAEQRLQQEWLQRDTGLPLQDPYEALILASIVEKETAVKSERGRIAGVFIRRLQHNMRLQTDPTVIYGMGDDYQGNIRRRDLRRDTPYNTYTRKGLPPTPIALASGEAIHAVLHPEPGNSLYFVSRGDGTHHFSDTLQEHNQAVIKYQLGGKAAPFSSSP